MQQGVLYSMSKCDICGDNLRCEHFPLEKDNIPQSVKIFKCPVCNEESYAWSTSKVDRQEFVQRSKNKPCMDCGGKFPLECMDFDHVPSRGQKKFNIGWSSNRETLESLKLEILKCDVICSNCHRTRTKKRRSGVVCGI